MSPLFPSSRWHYSERTIYPVRVALETRPLPWVAEGRKPRALDLFCGAGGASKGLVLAGFEVFGIDWTGQPHYPYEMAVERVERVRPNLLRSFDLIWASPPCQKWSTANVAWKNQDGKPDLIPMTRALLAESGVPYIMENVPQAPLRKDVLLCGSMFGLRLVRHRIFECGGGWQPRQPEHHDHHWKYVTVAGTTGGKSSRVAGIGYGVLSDWQEAMGIDWMPSRAMAQAVPPAYSEYLAREFLDAHDGADRQPLQGQEDGPWAGHRPDGESRRRIQR